MPGGPWRRPIIPPAPKLPERPVAPLVEPEPKSLPELALIPAAIAVLVGFVAGYGFALLQRVLGW